MKPPLLLITTNAGYAAIFEIVESWISDFPPKPGLVSRTCQIVREKWQCRLTRSHQTGRFTVAVILHSSNWPYFLPSCWSLYIRGHIQEASWNLPRSMISSIDSLPSSMQMQVQEQVSWSWVHGGGSHFQFCKLQGQGDYLWHWHMYVYYVFV